MAKYLLIRFEDDEDVNIDKRWFNNMSSQQEVIAVYKAPTVFCECYSVKNRGWTKGRKWGWWVCDQCGKPAGGVAIENRVNDSSFGYNLLHHKFDIEIPSE